MGARRVAVSSTDWLGRFGFRGSAQREPQKVWHDARESRNDERHCLDDAKHHSNETEGEHQSSRPSADAAGQDSCRRKRRASKVSRDELQAIYMVPHRKCEKEPIWLLSLSESHRRCAEERPKH